MRPPDARGVALAIVIGITLAGLVVWGSYTPVAANPCAPTNGYSLGPPPFAFSSPAESTVGGQHWYNFTVQSAGGSVLLDSFAFEAQTTSVGTGTIPPGATWNVTAWSSAGHLLGVYGWTSNGTGAWVTGGTAQFSFGEILSLFSSSQSLSGDNFFVTLAPADCWLGGSISIAIP